MQVKGIHLDVDVRGTAWFRHSDGRWRNFTSKITEVRIVNSTEGFSKTIVDAIFTDFKEDIRALPSQVSQNQSPTDDCNVFPCIQVT